MRMLRPILLSVAAAAVLVPGRIDAQRAGRWLTYEQAFPARPGLPPAPDAPLGELPTIVGWLDDDRFLEMRTEEGGARRLYAVAATDGRAQIYRDYEAMKREFPEDLDPSRPAAHTPDWRLAIYEFEGDLYLYDHGAPAPKLRRLTATADPERNPRLSPDARWIAYTRGNNLFAYDLERRLEHQYTNDGSETVYNGWASWVYYEEILGRPSQYAAFWWSPDSTRIAFMRFDDGPVPVFPIYHASGQHGELERQRYPKAGDPNPYVQVGIVSVEDGRIVWADFDPRADHYLAWPFWTADSRTLVVQWMNRGQDTLRLFACDASTGKKRQIFEERQAAWVDFYQDLHFFGDGSGFLLRAALDGYEHLYVHALDGSLKTRLTEGPWRVDSIEHVDEKTGTVYFMARPENATWDTQLMRVNLDGTGLEPVTTASGQHRVRVSPGGRYFIDTFSNSSTPQQMTLNRIDGTLVRKLGDMRTPNTARYAWGKAELFTIRTPDGVALPASWVLPPDFDPSRRYPVALFIYGGPDSGTVRNAFPSLQWHYWAQRGVIAMTVDHRGGGHHGKKGVWLMHRNLGKWEMADLAAAADWLRGRPFVRGDRIGISGGSYGGYVTMMALTYGAGTFNAGQAGSSVTDWKLYDTVYTERYMDTPAENPEGYRNGAVLTWIDRYRGGLRITHGTIDDNVHMQNTMQVVDWLTTHDRPFELMLYPGSRHGYRPEQRAHANREFHDYWVRHLLDGRMPQDAGTGQASSSGDQASGF